MFDYAEALHFANRSADEAGAVARQHFRMELSVEHKADDSPVTVADRGIEGLLRQRILQTYPTHGILGEEHGVENLDRKFVWVVDPIDGTKSFITGHPLFGGLMALLQDGEPRLGQIDMPLLDERWCGISGENTTLNGAPVKTSKCTSLKDAYAYTTDPISFDGDEKQVFESLKSRVRLMRYGGDCYNYALLASGFCDLVFETGLEPYDFLPVVQVVRGAGGVITDWNGKPLTVHSKGEVLAAATAELHAQALSEIEAWRATKAA